MSAAEAPPGFTEDQIEKGLKPGALGLIAATAMGVASTAPAYSLAVTLGLIVAFVGLPRRSWRYSRSFRSSSRRSATAS